MPFGVNEAGTANTAGSGADSIARRVAEQSPCNVAVAPSIRTLRTTAWRGSANHTPTGIASVIVAAIPDADPDEPEN